MWKWPAIPRGVYRNAVPIPEPRTVGFGVALMDGDAVAAGVELTSPSGVAAGASERTGVDVAGIAVAVESCTPDESSEELQAAASKNTSSTSNNAGALTTCHFGPARKSVVDGKLLCEGGGTIGRYQSVYGAHRRVASSTSWDLTQYVSAMVVRKT